VQDRTRELRGSAPLLQSALRQFAAVGFEGASLQRIASDAGLSKSSVLYHFASKEALLDAALRPAVEDLTVLVAHLADRGGDDPRPEFIAEFVDYLFEHRLAIAVLISHGQGLAGHAVVDEADALVRRLSECLGGSDSADPGTVRFGVALAGAAFMLVASDRWAPSHVPEEQLRATLVDVLGQLVLDRTPTQPA
jgi:AcrR family transcriptional regulator